MAIPTRGNPGDYSVTVTAAEYGMSRRRRVLAIIDEQEVTVVALSIGEILSTHLIEPDRAYWRNRRRDPGRWPGSQQTH